MILTLHNSSTVRTSELESFTILTKVLTNFFFSTELFLKSFVDVWFFSFMSLNYFLLLFFFSSSFFCVNMSVCSWVLSHLFNSSFLIFLQVCLNFFPISKVFFTLLSSFLIFESTYKLVAAWSTFALFYLVFDSTRMQTFYLILFTRVLGVIRPAYMFHFALFSHTLSTRLTVSVLPANFFLFLSLRI